MTERTNTVGRVETHSTEPGGARHILWVNHYAVTPTQGGGTRHFELGRRLADRGWRVTIAASDFDLITREYTRRESRRDRQPVVESYGDMAMHWLWSAPYQTNDWRRGLNWLTFARSVLRLPASVDKPDIVIGSSPHPFAALAAYRIAQVWGVPFIFEVRDLWPESLVAAGGRKGPLYGVIRWMSDFLYARSDRVMVLAQGSKTFLEEAGVPAARIIYLPNGVDVDMFDPAPTSTGPGLTCIYAGAHGPANGLDTVLEAAAILKESSEIRFRLVGDGPTKADLVSRAADLGLRNVDFHPPVPKSEVPALLTSADVGLMVLKDSPLFEFGVSPNKLFDYFAAGLPVACNVPGDVARMIRESGAGVQAEDSSGQALAKALRSLSSLDAATRAAMGVSGREWVSHHHGRAVLAKRLDALVTEVVEGPSRSGRRAAG